MKLKILIARTRAQDAVLIVRETDTAYHEPAKGLCEPQMGPPTVLEAETSGDGHELEEVALRWFFT